VPPGSSLALLLCDVGWTAGARYLWWFAGRDMVKALLALLLCSLEAIVLYRDPQAFVPPGPSLALLLVDVGWTAGARYLYWFAGRDMVKALLAWALCSLEAVVLYRDPQVFVSPGPSLAVLLDGPLAPDTCCGLQSGAFCSLEAVVLHRDPQAFVPAGSSLALSLGGQLEPDTSRGLQARTWSRCARWRWWLWRWRRR
jgi:hypothetical protein